MYEYMDAKMYTCFCILLLGACLFFDNMGSNENRPSDTFCFKFIQHFQTPSPNLYAFLLYVLVYPVFYDLSIYEIIPTKQEGLPSPPLPHP